MKPIDQKFITDLKHRIIIHAGFTIASKQDCRTLQNIIQYEVGSPLSESTLYRLFLSKQEQHSFYQSTLDILARFVGFTTWNFFCEHTASNEETGGRPIATTFDSAQPGLLDFVVRDGAWEIAEDYFDALLIKIKEETFHVLGWNIYLALQRNPKQEKKFYDRFAGHTLVRKAFFEIGADPDFSLPHYVEGFEQYLKHLPNIKTTQYYQDLLFAKSFLIRYHFIQGNYDQVVKLFDDLKSLGEEKLLAIQSVYPIARYFEAKILYLKTKQNGAELKLVYDAYLRWLLPLFDRTNLSEKKAAIHCMVEAAQLSQSTAICKPLLYKYFSTFIAQLFNAGATPSLAAVLERTEFNGIRLQQRVRG